MDNIKNIIQKLIAKGLVYGVRDIIRILKTKHANNTRRKINKNKEKDIKTISSRDKDRYRENQMHD